MRWQKEETMKNRREKRAAIRADYVAASYYALEHMRRALHRAEIEFAVNGTVDFSRL